MAASKSNVAITTIRTGHGDGGDTKLGGKTYRKGHLLVGYSAALDTAQAWTTALPESFYEFAPRSVMQETLFRLGAVIGSRSPKQQELALQEIGTMMERQIDFIATSLPSLDSFIRCTATNQSIQCLRAAVREAEHRCVAARDQIELEAKDTSPNLLYMLERSMVLLNIASDWVFAFVWLRTTVADTGKIASEDRWVPWTESKITELNSKV
jgi:cob(I)alamin adenosyltransferase